MDVARHVCEQWGPWTESEVKKAGSDEMVAEGAARCGYIKSLDLENKFMRSPMAPSSSWGSFEEKQNCSELPTHKVKDAARRASET